MNYEGIVIRPPSEAHSIILQVTVGCSHNGCAFCGAYRDVSFRMKSDADIEADLDFASRYCRRQNRVFLADGDALIMPQARLMSLLERIGRHLPWVNRVSLYAGARSIRAKSDSDLQELRGKGLDRVYLGVESGDDEVLAAMNKGETAHSLEEAGKRIRAAGLFLSVTVILGLAGRLGWQHHARQTAALLDRIRPNQIAALTLMVLDNTPLARRIAAGSFILPDATLMLRELQELLGNLQVDRVQFMANHASNYLPLTGRLQRDKPRLLAAIEAALAGQTALQPERLRAL